MKKILIAGGVIVAGAAAVTPYFLGKQAQERFAQAHERLQQEMVYPQLSAEAGEFKKGWFSSEASTKFTYSPAREDGETLKFEMIHHISQVPSLGEGALMTIDSELVLPEDASEALKGYFDGAPLLSAQTLVKFDGSQHTTFASPSYSGPQKGDESVQVEWQGLEGTSTVDAQMHNVSVSITAPALSFKDQEGMFLVNNLHYTTQLRRGHHDLWLGTSEASIDKFMLNVDSPKNGPTNIHMNNLHFSSQQNENNDLVNLSGKLTFDSAEVNGFRVENGVYDTGYNNLDAASLGQINTSMKQVMRQQPQDPGMLMAGILPHLKGLFSRKPELSIRQFSVDTPTGTIQGKMHMVLTEKLGDQVMQNPAELMNMVNLDIELSLPKPLLMGLFSISARNSVMQAAKAQEQTLSEDEVALQVTTVVQQQVEGLLAQKLMVDEGESYATAIHYTPQSLVINEQDVTPLINGLMQQ